jgi:hypothetical protein
VPAPCHSRNQREDRPDRCSRVAVAPGDRDHAAGLEENLWAVPEGGRRGLYAPATWRSGTLAWVSSATNDDLRRRTGVDRSLIIGGDITTISDHR